MFEPRYQISPQLLDTIKRITVLVYELNKRQLPVLALAQLTSEAQVTSTFASTSIEGNPLSLTEVRRILKQRPDHIRQSEREVLNYNQVLVALHNQIPPFTLDLILNIHRGVMTGLLPDELAGQWRREPMVIHDPRAGAVVFLPPDHQEVPALMAALVQFIQAQQQHLDPLLLAGIFHKQFVIIHPFIDGNGRTARLATNVLLAQLGVNLFKLLSFENYYNQNVTRYFQLVGQVGDYYETVKTLDFTTWLEYFAEGILDELRRVEKQLLQQPTPLATRLEAHHNLILTLIDQQGFVTDHDYAQQTDRAKATRTLDFKKLMDLGLIERKGRGRTTYYQRT